MTNKTNNTTRRTIASILIVGIAAFGLGACESLDKEADAAAPADTEAPYASADDQDIWDAAFEIAWSEREATVCQGVYDLLATGMSMSEVVTMSVGWFLEGDPSATDHVIGLLTDKLYEC